MTYSVQLYSVRNALEDDFDGAIRRLAEIGYRRVEPCAFETRTEELATAFTEHNITAPTGHTLLIPTGAPADIAADIPAETPPTRTRSSPPRGDSASALWSIPSSRPSAGRTSRRSATPQPT